MDMARNFCVMSTHIFGKDLKLKDDTEFDSKRSEDFQSAYMVMG